MPCMYVMQLKRSTETRKFARLSHELRLCYLEVNDRKKNKLEKMNGLSMCLPLRCGPVTSAMHLVASTTVCKIFFMQFKVVLGLGSQVLVNTPSGPKK